jgi:hypothetical protein
MYFALWGEQKVGLEVTKPPKPIRQLHPVTVVAINSSLLPKGRKYKVSNTGQAEPEPRTYGGKLRDMTKNLRSVFWSRLFVSSYQTHCKRVQNEETMDNREKCAARQAWDCFAQRKY